MHKHPSKLKWLLRLIGLGLLVVIAVKVGRKELLSQLAAARWEYVVPAIFLCLLHFCVKAMRWHYILARRGISVPKGKITLLYAAGSLLGLLTPGRVGEFAKAAVVRSWNRDASWGTVLGSIVLDRLIDVAAIATVAAAGAAWYLLPGPWRWPIEMLVLFLLLLGAGISAVVWGQLSASALGMRFKDILRDKFGVSGHDFMRTLKLAFTGAALPLVFWTLVANGLLFVFFALLGKALGSNLTFAVLTWGIALASLGSILPITISGIGIRDIILIALFGIWHEPAARVLAISLTYLGVLYVSVTALGVWPFMMGSFHMPSLYKKDGARIEDEQTKPS
ncbi:MAG: lysylphosphatidylglycerol synthase transmembrane domain-containing protein [Lentisphaerota bacterium]